MTSVPPVDNDQLAAELESALVREQQLRDWVAALVHDLRTPLQSTLGMVEIVLGTDVDVWQRSCLSTALDSGRSLAGIVDGLLDLLRLDSGRMQLESRPLALDALLARSLRTVAHRAHTAGLELDLTIEQDVELRVVGDELRLRQCLVNLLGNAVKFTEEGSVELVVRRLGDGRTRMSVIDTGIGMSGDQLARIFQAYEQAEASTARRFGGTGLGLSVTSRLVELMGGEISVESEVGAGSRFHIDLPLDPDPAPVVHRHLELGDSCPEALVLVRPHYSLSVLERCLGERRVAITSCASEDELVERLGAGALPELLVVEDALLGGAAEALRTCLEAHERRPLVLAIGQSFASGPGLLDFADETLVHPILCGELDGALEALLDPSQRQQATSEFLRTLVVDDDDVTRRVLQAMLGQQGHACEASGQVESALTAFESAIAAGDPYDLVLLDLQVGESDGCELAREMRAIQARRLPDRPLMAVAVTGAARETLAGRSMHVFDEILTKPISVEQIGQLLARAEDRLRGGQSAA